MLFARINPDTKDVEVREFSADPGRKGWVPLVIDPQPTPSATQVVIDAGITIGASEARQKWSLRDKSAIEIEQSDVAAERAKAEEILADLKTQRDVTRATWDGYSAAQLRAEQWRDRQVLLRAAALMLRLVK